ncbi:MAG: hypothetical protein HZB65_04085 [Candidatus Aenigmarchaeota archaeon]|nr:hypothetical protein [Candidatus Aenigmarchaeota archaeon]
MIHPNKYFMVVRFIMGYDLPINKEIVEKPYMPESRPVFHWHRIKLYTLQSYKDIIGDVQDAKALLFEILNKHPETIDNHAFSIAFAFGFKKENNPIEGIDVFSCRIKDWNNEPVYANCIY